MKIIQRVGYYLVGFSIGLVILGYFFKEKRVTICYLPNCRVLKEIKRKPLFYSQSVCDKIETDTSVVKNIKHLIADGEVDFSKSETTVYPRIYYVSYDTLVAVIKLYDYTSEIESFKSSGTPTP